MPAAVGPLYEAIGTQAFDSDAASGLGPEEQGSREFAKPALKRSLREQPQLRSFGVSPGETGIEEGWHGGSRCLKK